MKNLYIIAFILLTVVSFKVKGQSPNIKVEKSDIIIVEEPDEDIINSPAPSMVVQSGVEKLVFWVYGLGGNNTSWSKASYQTETYYLINNVISGIDYSSYSLATAGSALKENLISESNSQGSDVVDPAHTNFIIAHSQGGLVSKSAYKRFDMLNQVDERPFGGIVTFGTPHQGAQILNNIPDLLDFIGNSCNDLAAGPIDEAWDGTWFLSLLPDEIWINAVATTCGIIENEVVPFLMQDYLAPVTEDYKVGSPYLDTLNNFDEEMETDTALAIQKVAFYGVEEDPIVWRTVYSILNDVNIEGSFEANYDFEFATKANTNMNNYYAKYLAFKQLRDNYLTAAAVVTAAAWAILFWQPWIAAGMFAVGATFAILGNEAGGVAINYHKGWNWYVNVEEVYLSLIGAIRYERVGCECDCLVKYGSDPSPISETFTMNCDVDENCDSYMDNPPTNANVIWCDLTEVWENVRLPNDGVVLQESAQDYIGADNGENNLMYETNHMQMRNNSETGLRLQELMTGLHGDFFATDDRPE